PGGPMDQDPYSTELRLQPDGSQYVRYVDGDDIKKVTMLEPGEEFALIAGDNGEPRMPFIRRTDEQGQIVDIPVGDYIGAKTALQQETDFQGSETYKSNIEQLEAKGGLGKAFAEIYKGAVEEDSRLAGVGVVARGQKDEGYGVLKHTGGFALHKGDKRANGNYQ